MQNKESVGNGYTELAFHLYDFKPQVRCRPLVPSLNALCRMPHGVKQNSRKKADRMPGSESSDLRSSAPHAAEACKLGS